MGECSFSIVSYTLSVVYFILFLFVVKFLIKLLFIPTSYQSVGPNKSNNTKGSNSNRSGNNNSDHSSPFDSVASDPTDTDDSSNINNANQTSPNQRNIQKLFLFFVSLQAVGRFVYFLLWP